MAKPEIRITNVDEKLHAVLTNIANNKGISLSALMKHHLDAIIQSYPERLKLKRPRD
jgi:predicted HicB family RNase H-like nuclease